MTPATSVAAWLRVRLEPPRSDGSGEQPQDLAWWRGRILHAVLVAAAGLGTVAYVPSVALCLRERLWVMAATDTIAWIGMLSLLAARQLSYDWRARGVIAITYILPVLLIAEVAMPGAGLVWFCVFPILAAILLGLRAAVISLALFALTCAIFALAIAGGWWSWLAMPASPLRDLWVWIVDALNALLVSGMAALAMAALLRGLESTNRSLIDATAERERSEAERERLEAQLRQAQKLEAVGRLAGGIAHDFNNLLMPMLVYTDEVRRELPPGSDARERLGEVLQSAERARSLVQRILMFSRRTVAARAPVRVDAIVREAGGLLRAAIPSMIEIRYALATTRTVVIADAAELHQVIMNLGTNAAYAMRGTGGHLTFHVDEVDRGRLVRLRVIDTGAGMDAATLERAFEPFFTTKPVGEGSGLGLAAVHGIITSLGGQITLTSRPGLGTTVEMLLPRHIEHVEQMEHAEHGEPVETPQGIGSAASASSRSGRSEHSEPIVLRGARQRVLVVDDEPSVLAACHQLLDRLNYEVVACAHPAQALELLRKQPSAIDVLLTDQAMPHMTGPALAEAARRVRPDLPIVLATGFLDEKIRHAVEAIGIDQVLCKPYTVADLSAALSAALETRTRA